MLSRKLKRRHKFAWNCGEWVRARFTKIRSSFSGTQRRELLLPHFLDCSRIGFVENRRMCATPRLIYSFLTIIDASDNLTSYYAIVLYLYPIWKRHYYPHCVREVQQRREDEWKKRKRIKPIACSVDIKNVSNSIPIVLRSFVVYDAGCRAKKKFFFARARAFALFILIAPFFDKM